MSVRIFGIHALHVRAKRSLALLYATGVTQSANGKAHSGPVRVVLARHSGKRRHRCEIGEGSGSGTSGARFLQT